MYISWRTLRRRPGRLVSAALSFTLAVLVIVLIQGFADGMYGTYIGLIRNTPVDLWLGETGIKGVVNSSSVIPASLAREVEAIQGVRAVTPLYAVPVIAEVGDRKVPVMLYGYDLASGLGGPWSLAEGRAPAGPGEIVLDQAFAGTNGLQVGDRFALLGKEFRIAGLSAGTNSFMAFAAFAGRTEVGDLLGAQDRTSFLLVQADPGVDLRELRSRMPGGYEVRTGAELVASSEENLGRVMGAPLNLLLGVAFLVGLAVIALTTYSAVLERRDEYGVLRALGMGNGGLAAMVLTETLLSAVAGIAAGVLLAAGLALVLASALPAYPVTVTGAGLARTVLLGLLMALVAALVPLRRISRMDPAAVFRV